MNDTVPATDHLGPVHVDKALDALTEPALDPLFWRAERLGAPSAWWQHVPFAHWVVCAARPKVLVELGAYAGVSYSAFCQAVQRARLPTRCHAVDTWAGDHQAGKYDESVFNEFNDFNNEHFSGFSTLIRCTFDEALPRLEDASIDLLHIDGLHTYEAVKHDFESWRPKLSDSAVVLFHDVNERSGDYGVWRLWEELTSEFPSFTFLHGHGLGVLAVGGHPPEAVLGLCRLDDPRQIAAVRDRFTRIGERWLTDTRERMLLQRFGGVQAECNWAQSLLTNAQRELGIKDEQLVGQTTQLRDTTRHRDELLPLQSEAAALREALDSAHAELNRAQGSGATLRGELAAAQAELKASDRAEQKRADRAAQRAAQAREDRRTAIEEAARQLEDAARQVEAAEHAAARQVEAAEHAAARQVEKSQHDAAAVRTAMDRERSALQAELTVARAGASAATDELNIMRMSTIWRMTSPMRRAARLVPRPIRRAMRGGAKLVWWTATLQLPAKLRHRQRMIAHYADQATMQPPQPAPLPPPTVAAASVPSPTPPLASAPASAGMDILAPVASTALSDLRLVYLSGEAGTPGHIYRILRYAEAAAAAGIQSIALPPKDVQTHLANIEAASMLIVWRCPWDDDVAAAIAAARRGGAKIVFDVDDLMVDPALARLDVIDGIRSQFLTEDMVREHYSRVRQTMEAADVCFTTTDELAFYLRWAGKPTHVLPNGFDQATHDVSRRAAREWRRTRDDGLIRIGYAGGSRTHQKDFGLAVEGIARLLREDTRCRLVLFRTPDGKTPLIDIEEYPCLSGIEAQIEWRPLQSLARLPVELARFDINLAPLEFGNPFCEAKSELKFFEAALVDVPTVASPTGPFSRAIDHGKTGLLAVSADDWFDCLKRLADSAALRRELAAAAYHSVLGSFGPIRRGLDYRRALAQVVGGPAAADAFALQARVATEPRRRPKVYPSNTIFEHDKHGDASVTVIIPLYNYERHVVETLDSVRAQTLQALDLVIVDGFSTDDSLAVALSWARRHAGRFNRIAVLQNQSNIGLAFCRNSGFDAARTPYVYPLDADNMLLPTCCETLLRAIVEAGSAAVHSTIQHFGASSALLSAAPFVPQRFVYGNYIDAMALISKEAWALVGGYDHVRFGWEDYDFWCRLAEAGLGSVWVPETLGQYRVHEVSMMQTQTLAAGNYKRLLENFKIRHPWVSLVDVARFQQRPLPSPALLEHGARERLDTLLPILRCPVTGERLAWSTDRATLLSIDGLRAWPVNQGRAILTAGLDEPVIHPDAHISNELPAEALAIIRETKGLVLNLSAGGSAEKFDHVVEVEYAIFRHTDIVADAHVLPFFDDTFEAVVVMNAFEHYRQPHQVAAELLRILKPGGRIMIRTAFMQPMHERPWHFFNCTRYGLEEWFKEYETEKLHVSSNFCPNHSVAWLASEAEQALRADVSDASADAFRAATMGDVVDIWRDCSKRATPLWTDFEKLSQNTQDATAAGFEFFGRKKPNLPDLKK